MDDGSDGLALVIDIARYLFHLGQYELVVLVVNHEHLALPYLIYLAGDYLSYAVFIFVVKRIVLQFENLGSQSLSKIEDGAASELSKIDTLGNVLSHFVVGLYLPCLCQGNLFVVVLHLTVGHNHTVAVYLEVALVRIDNDIEVLVTAEYFGKNVSEALLKHAHQRSTVYVFRLLEFLERVEHTYDRFFFQCCHSSI